MWGEDVGRVGGRAGRQVTDGHSPAIQGLRTEARAKFQQAPRMTPDDSGHSRGRGWVIDNSRIKQVPLL